MSSSPSKEKKQTKQSPPTTTPQTTAALEQHLRRLLDRSNEVSQELTKRLATSESGKSLLNIGPSLSSLPPDLESLLGGLQPLLRDAEVYEEACREELGRVVRKGNEVRMGLRRAARAERCADLYEDLVCAEECVGGNKGEDGGRRKRDGDVVEVLDELDHASSLERTAHTTLHLVHELKSSTLEISALTVSPSKKQPTSTQDESSSTPTSALSLPSMRAPLPDDTEKAQFIMKLAPRIRRLESDVIRCLTAKLETVLLGMKRRKVVAEGGGGGGTGETEAEAGMDAEEQDLLIIGHCLRGLAILGRGKEAESTFARVAIMPIIRSKVSMGRLDEGGSRGECAGLFSLLDDIAHTIYSTFGSVLRLSEGIFDMSTTTATTATTADIELATEVDLVTAGVWVPIATALMADPAIKMSIFSPGIASILQANYTALDTFLSELATSLLKSPTTSTSASASADLTAHPDFTDGEFKTLYFQPTISSSVIETAQARIYQHPMTTDFSKKWNLPIYYQLRFGECCNRLNKAIERVQREGWEATVFTGSESTRKEGFEIPLFLELYDILLWLWRPDVLLRPIMHRFLRGAIQLIGRTVAFVRDGLEGKIMFGESEVTDNGDNGSSHIGNGVNGDAPSFPGKVEYCWGKRVEDVATVAWELNVLETLLTREYIETVVSAIASKDDSDRSHNINTQLTEIRTITSEVLLESSHEITPIITTSWNDIIAKVLTTKCSAPLSAVKGVAATYRMTNRPPPTLPSPFVATILRPLKEFDQSFSSRTPPRVGLVWKESVIKTVSDLYSVAVEELIATVQRTEVALKNRKTRRTASGGMSDGEKVKLQLYLDYQAYEKSVKDVGVDCGKVKGLMRLEALTREAESLYQRSQNGGHLGR